jgi:cytochrome c oxidase cbb3-type subunit I/II
VLLCVFNALMTRRNRPVPYKEPTFEAPALATDWKPEPAPPSRLEQEHAPVAGIAYKIESLFRAAWHRNWEALPVTFTVMVIVAVAVASLFEIIPTFLIKSNVPTIASVKPYTALELAGRDIYVSEGCYNCHSQMIRPIRSETVRYGEYSKPGEFVYDYPFQWGSRRIGPDLQRVGGKYPDLWHVRHMEQPRSITPQSIMPAYPWLLTEPIDYDTLPASLSAMRTLGVGYTQEDVDGAVEAAREQARTISAAIVEQGGRDDLEEMKIVALIAYLQRLGTDITRAEAPAEAVAEQTATGGGATGASSMQD